MKKVFLSILVLVLALSLALPTIALADDGVSGPGTPGYWKKHVDAWPVEEVMIGLEIHSKDEAVDIMRMPVRGDMSLAMFSALVAAKLNLTTGSLACQDVIDVVIAADAWMAEHPVGSGVKASSEGWQVLGESLLQVLDDYNNGFTPCVP